MTEKNPFEPKTFSELIVLITISNSDSKEYRGAVAEINVRAILAQQKSAEAQEKATKSLSYSTWVLAAATVALVIVGFVQVIVAIT